MIDAASRRSQPTGAAPRADTPDVRVTEPGGLQDLLRTIDGRLLVLRARVLAGVERVHPGGTRSQIAMLGDAEGRLYLDVFSGRSALGEPDLALTLAVRSLAEAAERLEALGRPRRARTEPTPKDAVQTLAAYAERARWEAYVLDFDAWLGDVLAAWSTPASAA